MITRCEGKAVSVCLHVIKEKQFELSGGSVQPRISNTQEMEDSSDE